MKKIFLCAWFVACFVYSQAQHDSNRVNNAVADSTALCANEYADLLPDQIYSLKQQKLQIEKLSPEKYFELEKIKVEEKNKTNWEGVMAIGLGFLFFIMIGFIFFMILFYRHKSKLARYKIIEKAVEQGKELPENLFVETGRARKNNYNPLEIGIPICSLGVGSLLTALILKTNFFAVMGLFLLVLGLSYVLIYFLRKRSQKKNRDENEVSDLNN
ncbi:MAG: DUF6249 domain-containing protein [Bacteroidales bacterium]